MESLIVNIRALTSIASETLPKAARRCRPPELESSLSARAYFSGVHRMAGIGATLSLARVPAKVGCPPGEAIRGPSRLSGALDPEPTAQTDPFRTFGRGLEILKAAWSNLIRYHAAAVADCGGDQA
jgi:hypothetical protein